jgi:hypothetical protein
MLPPPDVHRGLVFKTSAASLYRPGLHGSIAWIRTTTSRRNRAVDYLLSHDGIESGLPGRTHTCDLRVRSSAFCNLNYGELKLVGHLGSAPSIFPFQTGRIAIFLVPAKWRPGRVLPPLSPARQAGESAVPLPSRKWWVMVVTLHSSSSDLV